MFSLDFFIVNFPVVLQAVPLTLGIALASVILSTLFGAILAVIKIKRIPVLYPIASIFMSFSRSVPNLAVLYFLYFAFPYFVGALRGDYSIALGANKLNPNLVAIITFTITFSVYFAEVFRSAYYSVDKGQFEAAWSIGLPTRTYLRRIIFPQATIQALPNYTSVVIDLIKDTSLVYTISVMDIMGKATFVAARGFHYIDAYLIAFVVYLIICFTISKSLRYLEVKLSCYR